MTRTEITDQAETVTETDVLVPDPRVREEFGGVSEMTIHRWDRDPQMAALGWPPPIRIRNRKFRSRRALEAFKATMARRAVAERANTGGVL